MYTRGDFRPMRKKKKEREIKAGLKVRHFGTVYHVVKVLPNDFVVLRYWIRRKGQWVESAAPIQLVRAWLSCEVFFDAAWKEYKEMEKGR